MAPPPAHPSSTALVVLVISGSPGCPGVSLLQAPPRLQAGSRCYGDHRCKLDAWTRRVSPTQTPPTTSAIRVARRSRAALVAMVITATGSDGPGSAEPQLSQPPVVSPLAYSVRPSRSPTPVLAHPVARAARAPRPRPLPALIT